MTSHTLAKLKNAQKGFTLIELLIVIVIITALAVTVFVALNPVKRTRDAREARRASDVETILTAIHEYVVDNNGTLPGTLTSTGTGTALTMLGTGASCALVTNNTATSNVPNPWSSLSDTNLKCGTPAACIDLTTPLAPYLKSMPIDPKGATSGPTSVTLDVTKSGYAVAVNTSGIVTVVACGGENTVNPISQSR